MASKLVVSRYPAALLCSQKYGSGAVIQSARLLSDVAAIEDVTCHHKQQQYLDAFKQQSAQVAHPGIQPNVSRELAQLLSNFAQGQQLDMLQHVEPQETATTQSSPQSVESLTVEFRGKQLPPAMKNGKTDTLVRSSPFSLS
ncbi:unnamed protein product [Soboliphyme baturini]|uniref:ATP synthase-coupling factor 6, mitochondrial n=1 Tax=Soboliphyme baturini TaxID=241478 RepID=A0A183IE46_9BILA|nr:unnamed protein product [Soboliphyme baturini]